jgi:hypothetical protein
MVNQDPLAGLSREAMEAAIDALIARLDQLDGDYDLEEDNEDACPAGDDGGTGPDRPGWLYGGSGPGDPDDAEDGCDEEPDGCGGNTFSEAVCSDVRTLVARSHQ